MAGLAALLFGQLLDRSVPNEIRNAIVMRAPEIMRAPEVVRAPDVVRGGVVFPLCSHGGQRTCVIDGDTVRYQGERIRLLDIDAPETRGAQCAAEADRGRRATLRLQELLNEGPFEVVRQGSRDVDVYGRQLRVLARDGRSFGAILVAEGLARPWDGARRSWCG